MLLGGKVGYKGKIHGPILSIPIPAAEPIYGHNQKQTMKTWPFFVVCPCSEVYYTWTWRFFPTAVGDSILQEFVYPFNMVFKGIAIFHILRCSIPWTDAHLLRVWTNYWNLLPPLPLLLCPKEPSKNVRQAESSQQHRKITVLRVLWTKLWQDTGLLPWESFVLHDILANERRGCSSFFQNIPKERLEFMHINWRFWKPYSRYRIC